MQTVGYQMEQKRIKTNSRSESLGILSASLCLTQQENAMPMPLGQLRDYRGPSGGNFCENQTEQNRKSCTQKYSMERTPVRERIKATCHPIYKGFGQPTSHIMF